MKAELKLEYTHAKPLDKVIKSSYFEDESLGRLVGKKSYLTVEKETDDVLYVILKGLNNATVRIYNSDIIDGTARFIVDETDGSIKLYPISMFCIQDSSRYIFY